MNAKTRLTIAILIVTLLGAITAPAAHAEFWMTVTPGNHSFDILNEHGFAFLNPWWTLANKSGDAIDCSGEVVTAASGDCMFRFKGGAGEASVLSQTVKGDALDGLNDTVDGATTAFDLNYEINSLSTATKLKAKAIVSVQGSTTKYKSVANFNGSTMIGEFTSWVAVKGTRVDIPAGSVVTKVKFVFANQSTKGQVFIDQIEAYYSPLAM